MEYIEGLSSQWHNFLLSLGFGMFLGVAYDVLRGIRLLITNSKKAIYFADFLFAVFSSVTTFLFCLTTTNGELRWYVIFAEITGFFVYYFTFGVLFMRFVDKTVSVFRKTIFSAFHVISLPFVRIFNKIKQLFAHFVEKTQKKLKKTVKKSKFHLQINRTLLYNLTDRMRLFGVKADKTKEK